MLKDKRGEIIEIDDEIAVSREIFDNIQVAKVADVSVTAGPIPLVELLVRVVVPAPEGNMRYALKCSERQNQQPKSSVIHQA